VSVHRQRIIQSWLLLLTTDLCQNCEDHAGVPYVSLHTRSNVNLRPLNNCLSCSASDWNHCLKCYNIIWSARRVASATENVNDASERHLNTGSRITSLMTSTPFVTDYTVCWKSQSNERYTGYFGMQCILARTWFICAHHCLLAPCSLPPPPASRSLLAYNLLLSYFGLSKTGIACVKWSSVLIVHDTVT